MHISFDKDRYHEQREMEQWCEQQFGKGAWVGSPYPKEWTALPDWTIHCMFGQTTFAFKNEKDYALFILRWS